MDFDDFRRALGRLRAVRRMNLGVLINIFDWMMGAAYGRGTGVIVFWGAGNMESRMQVLEVGDETGWGRNTNEEFNSLARRNSDIQC